MYKKVILYIHVNLKLLWALFCNNFSHNREPALAEELDCMISQGPFQPLFCDSIACVVSSYDFFSLFFPF